MSCWVVPLIAADYLSIPVEEVMRRISDGVLPVRYEDGFTFVDVLPHVNGEASSAQPAITYVPADEPDLVLADASGNTGEYEADAPDILFSWKDARHQAAQRRQRPIAA